WLLHRRYTKAEYRAVVDAIRIFDRVLTEFKDKFESDRYPNPILVYAEAGMDMDHDVFHARRGGRFKPERVFAGAYGPMSEEEKKRRVDETLRVFIGWEGISLKIIYDRLFRPIARLQPLALFIHELMHHVETVRGIPHSIESHTDEKLLELARKELATS